MSEYRLNLITGQVEIPTEAELAHEERMTELTKQRLGQCDRGCRYAEPFGWVPEADCPVHDK